MLLSVVLDKSDVILDLVKLERVFGLVLGIAVGTVVKPEAKKLAFRP